MKFKLPAVERTENALAGIQRIKLRKMRPRCQFSAYFAEVAIKPADILNKRMKYQRLKHSLLLTLLAGVLISSCKWEAKKNRVVPTPEQVAWADKEIGVIIYPNGPVFTPDSFRVDTSGILSPASGFNPSSLNTDQWIEAAKAAGARFAILEVKQKTGFAFWPTLTNDFNISKTPWKNGTGDVVADFIRSCNDYGLSPGICFNTRENLTDGSGDNPVSVTDPEIHNQVILQQLTELMTNYGALSVIWFDGGVPDDEAVGITGEVASLINTHQPQALLIEGPAGLKNLIHRAGNEEDHDSGPGLSTTRLTDPSLHPFSPEELLDRYYTTVGQNATMLIGMAIDTTGTFPETDRLALEEFGERVKSLFSSPAAGKKGEGRKLTLNVADPGKTITHLVICEEITHGERIRGYKIQMRNKGKWETVCEGTSVGHKKIHKIAPVETTALRLKVTESKGKPMIREFTAYY